MIKRVEGSNRKLHPEGALFPVLQITKVKGLDISGFWHPGQALKIPKLPSYIAQTTRARTSKTHELSRGMSSVWLL